MMGAVVEVPPVKIASELVPAREVAALPTSGAEKKKVSFADGSREAVVAPAVAPMVVHQAAAQSVAAPPALRSDLVESLAQSIEQLMASTGLFSLASPQDMVRLGMGMGLAMLSQQQQQQQQQQPVTREVLQPPALFFPSLAEGQTVDAPTSHAKYPIGLPHPTNKLPDSALLDHAEESRVLEGVAADGARSLSGLERAQELSVREADPTPGAAALRLLDLEPANSDEAVRALVPVLVYPEVSTVPLDGAPAEVLTHKVAGVDDAFSRVGDESSHFVAGTAADVKLRKTVRALPSGFYQAIVSKHIATQGVEYLPQVPNLPQTHSVGRVRPRSAAHVWLALNFDPWSAGKPPLSNMFIESLATQAGKLFKAGEGEVQTQLELLRSEVTKDAFISVEDKEGIEQTRAVTSKAHVLAADFKKLCSMARHGKFIEVENLMNQPDWELPINYTDEQGRTLLHVVCQNGNKRTEETQGRDDESGSMRRDTVWGLTR